MPVFRTGVSQVRVDIQVTYEGTPVKGLAAEDFVVYDEGVPQKATYFGHEAEPLSLLLLLDVSGSMNRFLEQIARTAQKALRYLSVGDRAAVLYFGRTSMVQQPFTGDLVKVGDELRVGYRGDDLGAGTDINGSLLDAAAYFKRYGESDLGRAQERRAVLMLTDNQALHYQTPDEKVIRELWGVDAVLNAIVVGKGERPVKTDTTYRNPDFTPADVFRIAEETGGEAIKADRADQTFAAMIDRIRTRYVLGYNAPQAKPGTFRRIRVELTAAARQRYPNAVIRARSGYTAAS
jgi:VWFA-related protein